MFTTDYQLPIDTTRNTDARYDGAAVFYANEDEDISMYESKLENDACDSP